MATTAFNTLKAKKTLTNAGIKDTEAEAMVEMTHEAVSENVATTGDIVGLTAALTAETAALKAEIASLEARMMARMTVGFLGLAGLIVAAIATNIAVLSLMSGN